MEAVRQVAGIRRFEMVIILLILSVGIGKIYEQCSLKKPLIGYDRGE